MRQPAGICSDCDSVQDHEKKHPGYALRLIADLEGLDAVEDQLDDIATQINALPEQMPTVDLQPLQADISRINSSMDSLRSHINKLDSLCAYVDNLLNAIENIKIVMPKDSPPAPEKPKEWTATVTKRNAGGGIKEVSFSAGG